MMQCPICQAELSVEEKLVFTTCPGCNSLLAIAGNDLEKVDEHKIREKYWKVNSLVKWACESILGHQWSDEGYVLSNDESYCTKLRVCRRCFDTAGAHIRERHAFVEEYIKDDACEKRRVCTRCGQIVISNYPEHVFTLPDYYFRAGTCQEERKCSHCGLVEELGTKHAFSDDDWVLLDRSDCKSRRFCRRCGQEELAIRHAGAWIVLEEKASPNGEDILYREKRICEVCGQEETREYWWNNPYHN